MARFYLRRCTHVGRLVATRGHRNDLTPRCSDRLIVRGIPRIRADDLVARFHECQHREEESLLASIRHEDLAVRIDGHALLPSQSICDAMSKRREPESGVVVRDLRWITECRDRIFDDVTRRMEIGIAPTE